jgi:hypothetical protein
MRNRSNRRCRRQPPMRHAETDGRHLGAPYVGSVPDGIHVHTGERLARRSVQAPDERPVAPCDRPSLGYRVVAACQGSWGETRGVPMVVWTDRRGVSSSVGGDECGLWLLPFLCRYPACDSLYCFVSLPTLGLAMPLQEDGARDRESVWPGACLPASARVPLPSRRCAQMAPWCRLGLPVAVVLGTVGLSTPAPCAGIAPAPWVVITPPTPTGPLPLMHHGRSVRLPRIGRCVRFRRCAPRTCSVRRRCPSDILAPGEPGWEACPHG